MEQYTAQVAELVEEIETEAESDSVIDESESEVEEDPDFPLPTSYSEDEDDQGSPLLVLTHSSSTHPPASSAQSLQGKT